MNLALLERRVERERKARKEAERLLEQKSFALYDANQRLQFINEELHRRTNELALANAAQQSARVI